MSLLKKFPVKRAVFLAVILFAAASYGCFGFFHMGAPDKTVVTCYDSRGYQILSTVYVDGNKVGYTPYTLDATEGQHKIRVENYEYPVFETLVDAGKGKPVNVVFKWNLKDLADKCAADDMPACSQLAAAIISTPGGTTVETKIIEYQKKAASLAQEGCTKENSFSCAMLGIMYLEEKGRVKDAGKALDLGKKACEKGEILGCYAAGRAVWESGDETQYAYAEKNLSEACVRNISHACAYLGEMELAASVAQKDQKKAAEIEEKGVGHLEKSCKMGSGYGCATLGELYYKGSHVEENQFMAFPLFKKGCFLLSGKGCYYWAKGIKKNIIDAETITVDEVVKRAQILGYKGAGEEETEDNDEE
jgi:TPR repeat protein